MSESALDLALPAARPRAETFRPLVVIALCLPLLAFFTWLMIGRLNACPKGINADFVQEWTSARNFWTGRPIYLPLTESAPIYFGPEAHIRVTVNAHPPTAVLVAIPFGLTDFRTGWLVWNLLSLAALGGSLWLLMRAKGLEYAAWTAVPLATLLLASNSLGQQVIEGQLNLLLLAMLVGCWWADREDRPILAGVLLGAATAIKLYPGLLLVYFLARRQWRALAAATTTVAALALLSGVCFGPEVFLTYVREVMPQFAHYGDDLGNASLAGVWSKVFVGTAGYSEPLLAYPAAAKWALLASGLAIAALCGWKSWRANTLPQRDLAFAACVVGMLLASPITWGHSFVLLLLPLLVAWRYSPKQPGVRWAWGLLIVLLWIVRNGWISKALVPGVEALSLGVAPHGFRIAPVYALVGFAYATYALLAIFGLALFARPVAADQPAIEPRS